MTQKHTAGPWAVTRKWLTTTHGTHVVKEVQGRRDDGSLEPKKVILIANAVGTHYQKSFAQRKGCCSAVEREANARLIAADPEMLAALEYAERVYRQPPKPSAEIVALETMRNAIAKAKGEL